MDDVAFSGAGDFDLRFPQGFDNVGHHAWGNNNRVAGALGVNDVDLSPLAVSGIRFLQESANLGITVCPDATP